MKSFTVNKLYILESLDPNQANGEYLKPARELKKAMDAEGVPCELIEMDGLVGFYTTMTKIANDCWNGVKPILHFVCHSGKLPDAKFPLGLVLWNSRINGNEVIKWRELEDELEQINTACRFNLFVTMSVCEALISLEHLLDKNHRIPFCGILASPDPIKLHTSTLCFKEYYVALIQKLDVNAAYGAYNTLLQKLNQQYIAKGLKPESIEQHFADDLFTKFAKLDFQTNRSKIWQVRKLAIKELIKEYKVPKKQLPEKLIQAFIGKNYELLWGIHKGMQDYKFMLDIYPDQLDRFNLPRSIEDLKK